jgi:hypothetical protein
MSPSLPDQQRPVLALAALLSSLVAPWAWPGPAGAAEVWAESILDQASALRDAREKVPAGARELSSSCRDVALRGLSFRYRCSVRFEPAPASPASPASTAKPPATAPGAAQP